MKIDTQIQSWPLVVAILLIVSGCANRECPVCLEKDVSVAKTQESRCGDPFDSAAEAAFVQTFGDASSVDILLLSGGGSRGPFGAGILAGWDEGPVWDMVTGISTGSIMATYAYLGPDYYEQMETVFGKLTSNQISQRRWLFPFVDSLYTLKPLVKSLRTYMDTETIVAVGKEYHDTGRQLWIGSTNLDTGEFCHWNLGQRAYQATKVKNDPGIAPVEKDKQLKEIAEEYYKLIIASSANPTVFQPVQIDGYTHVDGGVTQPIYVEELGFIAQMVKEKHKELNVYAIVHSRMVTSQQCVNLNLYDIASRSVSLIGKANLRADLSKIQTTVDEAVGEANWQFHTAWLPADLRLDPADTFCQSHMRELFEFGEGWIKDNRWCLGLPDPGAEKDSNCYTPSVGKKSCGGGKKWACE